MYWKSEPKNGFTFHYSNQLPVLYCYSTEMGPPRQGSQAGAALLLTRLALTAPGAGLLLPLFSPFHLEKALFYLHIQELVGLVCFFGTINKRSNVFLLLSLNLSMKAAISFDSSVARRLPWPNGPRNACTRAADGCLHGMWGSLCTSGWEMTKKSRSKGWYIIYIYQCYYS